MLGVILYELIVLWGSQRTTSMMMGSGYLVVHFMTLAFSGLYAHKLSSWFSVILNPLS